MAKVLELFDIEAIPMTKASGKVGKIPLSLFDADKFVKFLDALGKYGGYRIVAERHPISLQNQTSDHDH